MGEGFFVRNGAFFGAVARDLGTFAPEMCSLLKRIGAETDYGQPFPEATIAASRGPIWDEESLS